MPVATVKSPDSRLDPGWLVAVVLVLTGWLLYGRTLADPFITFDDPGYVVNNPHVRAGLTWSGWDWAWTSFEQANWHPLTWLSLMLDAQWYGMWAGGFHLTNLLLHLGNGLLLFYWLRKATGALWPSGLTAWFFVAHPLHVESVAWVTERKDVLSATFFLLTLLAYTRYAQRGDRWAYGWALACFALGLAAKPMLVTLPPLLLLLDHWPLRRMSAASLPRLLVEKLPFAALAAASCVVTILAQRTQAMVPLGNLPLTYRAAAVALSYGEYLKKTFLPWDLSIYYPYWQAQSFWKPVGWLGLLTAVSLAAWVWRRHRPDVLVGWGWFLGMLVPVIGVVQVGGQAVADRYTYLPHIGLFVAIFWLGAAWWRQREGWRPLLGGLTALAAAGCVVLGGQQVAYWRSGVALFEHAVAVVPPNGYLCQLLGNTLVEAGEPARAAAAYQRAWQLRGLNTPTAVLPLTTLLLRAERWQEAAAVLAPWQTRPDQTPELMNQLATAYNRTGREREAEEVLRRGVEKFPDDAATHFAWAAALQKRGDASGSAAQDEAGLSLQPDEPAALGRLAWNYTHSGDLQAHASAEALAQRAVTLTGGRDLDSLNVLAFAQAVNGRWDAAVATGLRAQAIIETAGKDSPEAVAGRERLERYRHRSIHYGER